MSISEKDCIEWSKNKLINPFTNRPIVKNGPTYTFFNENCEKYLQSSHCFNLKGFKNIGGTSCYMDSVLFALLAVPNSFVQKNILNKNLSNKNKKRIQFTLKDLSQKFAGQDEDNL